jgi:hypothetical protein
MSADLVSRAFAAYFRGGGAGAEQPASTSGLVEHEGKQYVVLHNANGILAVYRVRSYDGILKALKRWPKKIEVCA